MNFGLALISTDFGVPPAKLAQRVEALGFESLFFGEHSHIPVDRRSPFPYGEQELDRSASHGLDPFIALSAAAATTQHLRLGTGVCLVVARDPIRLAKEVATLDHLSHGRFLFGIGGGWNLEEMENHGTDPRRRWKVLRERVEAMKTIWTQDEASYHGEFVNFEPIWQWPKPAQKPHPPILLGGDGKNTLRRIARYADGWMPLAAYDPDDLTPFKQRIAELNRLAAEAGRGPIPVTIVGVPLDLDALKRYEDAGVERIVFWRNSITNEELEPVLDTYEGLIRHFD